MTLCPAGRGVASVRRGPRSGPGTARRNRVEMPFRMPYPYDREDTHMIFDVPVYLL